MTKHEISTDGIVGEDHVMKKVYEAPVLRVLSTEDTSADVNQNTDNGVSSS